MAGFQAHVNVATVVSVVGIALTSQLGLFSFLELLYLFFIGVLSTTFPDLDSDSSKPLLFTYKVISFVFPTAMVLVVIKYGLFEIQDNLLNLLYVFGISFFFFFFFFLFLIKFTKHRGIFHSVPMGLAVSFLMMSVVHMLDVHDYMMLFSGFFTLLGFLTHLLLDELYSIIRFKKSFGTAFKFYDSKNIFGTILLYFYIIVSIFIFPCDIFLCGQNIF